MAITRATNLADIGSGIGTNPSQTIGIGPGIQMDGSSTGIITATTFSGTATNAGTAVNLGIGATGYGLVLSANLTGIAATFSGNVTVGGTLTYDDVTNIDSVGLITARNGLQVLAGITTISGQSNLANVNVSAAASFGGNVSIADSIFHTGDTNTAIRFPAADTFTVETAGSERTRVDSSGRLLLGTSTSRSIGAGAGYPGKLQVESSGFTNTTFTQNTNDIYGPEVNLGKSRGAAAGGTTVVQSGDQLGIIQFAGADGTDLETNAAAIECRVDGTPGSNDMPGRLVFYTTADGAALPTERLRITSAGAAIFKGGLAEKYENAGTTLGAQTNQPLSDGNVILFTGNESGNKTINFTGVHATLSSGETVSFTAIITPNNSGVINVVQVDGQAITVKWSGGSVPTAGASGQDIYTFQILKTGTGTSDYTVFGAAANYA